VRAFSSQRCDFFLKKVSVFEVKVFLSAKEFSPPLIIFFPKETSWKYWNIGTTKNLKEGPWDLSPILISILPLDELDGRWNTRNETFHLSKFP